MKMDDLPFEIIRKKGARRMKLTVDPRDGAVRLVLPLRAALGPAVEWARTHDHWIARQKARMPAAAPIVPGMQIPFAGRELRLDWAEKNPRGPKVAEDRLIVGGPEDALEARVLRWLKREALRLLDVETREYAARAGVEIGRVGVGDPRSRWGSCSASGDIRFSWRLILAPAHVRRATVAHEVAHRIHMDHSPAFHALVDQLYEGDPKTARHWLRAHGAGLHRLGRSS
jgi:predicted metal-dependent hydrolase